MNPRASKFAVATVTVTLAIVCFVVARQSSSSRDFIAPSGIATPEGAACDYVTAYIQRSFDHFEATRMHNFCETPQDIVRAYDALIYGEHPVHISIAPGAARPIRIVDVRPAQSPELTPCQQNLLKWHMMAEHGGGQCVVVTVVTTNSDGVLARHHVEVFQHGDEWKVSREARVQGVSRPSGLFGCPS